MLGATLASVVNLVKSEIRASLSAGSADDPLIKQTIETRQEWLAAEFDWEELEDEWTMNVVLGGRYTLIPTADIGANAYAINFDRGHQLWVKWNDVWQPVDYGLCLEDYNCYDSDNGETSDPIQKWRFRPGDRFYAETWPVAATAQVCRFDGQRKLKTLRTAGTLDTTLTLDLDDQLVALAAAVKLTMGKPENAEKVALYNSRFTTVRGTNKKPDERYFIGGGNGNQSRQQYRRTKLVVVA
jgi:hypothetical protein